MNMLKMRYSIEPREKRYLKGYGLLSFAKNIGKNISNKYSQNLVDSAKNSGKDVIKNCFKKSNSKNSRSNW